MNDELSIKLFKELEKTPKQSQRALSQSCGVSLGSIHYCLNALIEKGYLKATNFKNAKNKLAYAYILTPSGITLKKELTLAFLKRKQADYDALQKEIAELEEDLRQRWCQTSFSCLAEKSSILDDLLRQVHCPRHVYKAGPIFCYRLLKAFKRNKN